MKVVTMGQGTAERYLPAAGSVCVSIKTPGAPNAELQPGWSDVLRLEFADAPWADHRDHAYQLTDEQADEVARFLARHMETAHTCVIHCTVGASRSVSMAMAIEDCGWAKFEKPEWWIVVDAIPNPNVYGRVVHAIRRASQQPEFTGGRA